MSTGRHSGFARFEGKAARDTFVDRVLLSDSSLESRAHISSSQPTIVFEGLSDAQKQRVLSALEGFGKWFGDVQFEPSR